MAVEQQPVRVLVEMVDRRDRNRNESGWGVLLAVMLILGLIIEYWYIALGLVGLVLLGVVVRACQASGQSTQPAKPAASAAKATRSKAPASARSRSSLFDPWLNALTVELADFGLVARSRGDFTDVGGAAVDTSITLGDERLDLTVYLLQSTTAVSHATLGLKASPEFRQALSDGTTIIGTAGRILYIARGRNGIVDEFRVRDLVGVIRAVRPSPPTSSTPPQPPDDVVNLLRRLASLHADRVLSDAEFQSKKADLLQRI